MQYKIDIVDGIACITLEDELTALDLIFMTQSQDYKSAVSEHSKILIDYTNISGSTLTADDIFGVTMLGKRSLEAFGDMHIAVAVDKNEQALLETITKTIFSGSQTKIDHTHSRQEAMQILKG